MKIHEINVIKRSSSNRVGRGISAGQGKTAGRGTKGQKSRTGAKRKPGFEGGQNPLTQRFPKLRGFRSHRQAIETVSTGDIAGLGSKVDNGVLAEVGLVSSRYSAVKLIVKGDITKKQTVKLQAASKMAVKMLEKAGGNFEVTPRENRPKTTVNTTKVVK